MYYFRKKFIHINKFAKFYNANCITISTLHMQHRVIIVIYTIDNYKEKLWSG